MQEDWIHPSRLIEGIEDLRLQPKKVIEDPEIYELVEALLATRRGVLPRSQPYISELQDK